MNELKFYKVSDDYINFLRKHDTGVQMNASNNKTRPYVGILLRINEHDYYAPLSSYKPKFQKKNATFAKIYNNSEQDPVSVIKFNCMIPILSSEFTYIDFALEEKQYSALLQAEYEYIKSNQDDFLKQAENLYTKVNKGNRFLVSRSCNFKLLENIYKDFEKTT
ncbi:type III toxin-antitoxin system ToxN/AbiQ family toxin [Paenibacillus sp. CFBP13512]|uniref:type III toxin-antitoxin system ToxN/AbiQ family toxin n=1 Tax=Paenibacillus sp. CFBP13512 TaxID=2184007 RepID=UPI001375994C|nr:type III toxin-antitoxin system ToxN/AbiQ family toxin [Paenibacillus sp. CFBP13512]